MARRAELVREPQPPLRRVPRGHGCQGFPVPAAAALRLTEHRISPSLSLRGGLLTGDGCVYEGWVGGLPRHLRVRYPRTAAWIRTAHSRRNARAPSSMRRRSYCGARGNSK